MICVIRYIMMTCALGLGAFSVEAHAQFQSFGPQRNYGGAFRTPRSAILGRPTVSPYLALTDLTGTGAVDTSRNYFTQVRPALNNQAEQRRQQQALVQIQQSVQTMRSAVARQSQGQARATGHPTRFNMMLQYYPGFRR